MNLIYALCFLPLVFPKIKKRYPDKSGVFHIATSGVICLLIYSAFYGMGFIFAALKGLGGDVG
tara:strand:+ start:342 stop:530 length:189 start_codon:yes stop_codon:yes gene_type:complete